MRTLFKIFAAALAVLVMALAGVVYLYGDDPVAEGRKLYSSRRLLQRAIRRHKKEAPLMIWMGDSTLMRGRSKVPPYPRTLTELLKKYRFVETRLFAQPAADPYLEYCAIGKLLETNPDLIGIVANPRIMAITAGTRGFLSLASYIPLSEFGRAIWLPWHHRQVTIPRILLAKSLIFPEIERAFHLYEGLRQMFRDELYSTPLKLGFSDRFGRRSYMFAKYAQPVQRPVIDMLAATVDMAVRRGTRVLVVMTPIPIEVLRENDMYTPRTVEQVEEVGHAVEGAGGIFVDLHDALGRDGFRDTAGHFTEAGARRVAELLEPTVRAQLAESWPGFEDSPRGRRKVLREPVGERP